MSTLNERHTLAEQVAQAMGKSVYNNVEAHKDINRNNFLSCSEIRPDQPKEKQAIEWIAFASNVHNTFVPLYADVDVIPEYFSNTTLTPTTGNLLPASSIPPPCCFPR